MEVLEIKFENWNFRQLFENGIFFKNKFLTSKDEKLRGPTLGFPGCMSKVAMHGHARVDPRR